MAKKATKEETLPVEQVVVQATPVVDTEEAVEVGEAIIEELDLEDVVIVEEVVEVQPTPVVEAKPTPVVAKLSNEVAVVSIVQKTPSGFRVLLETGEIVKVSKAQYTKGQPTIIV